jgi:hypothetical protein
MERDEQKQIQCALNATLNCLKKNGGLTDSDNAATSQSESVYISLFSVICIHAREALGTY